MDVFWTFFFGPRADWEESLLNIKIADMLQRFSSISFLFKPSCLEIPNIQYVIIFLFYLQKYKEKEKKK